VISLPGTRSGSGIAVAPTEQLLWVASQGTDNVLLIDLKSGDVVKDLKVGAGPLNIVWDDKDKLAFVAVRANGQVTALNTKGEAVANLEAGRQPNHISTDGKGNLFVVHKAASTDKNAVDQVTRLHVK
jgi:DNA-binding beta-propeller fold protein YncE